MGVSSSGVFEAQLAPESIYYLDGDIKSRKVTQSSAKDALAPRGIGTLHLNEKKICFGTRPCHMGTRQTTLLSTVREGGYASFTSLDGREGNPVRFVPSPLNPLAGGSN